MARIRQLKPERSTSFFSLTRRPMGGQFEPVAQVPAAWVAGQTKPC